MTGDIYDITIGSIRESDGTEIRATDNNSNKNFVGTSINTGGNNTVSSLAEEIDTTTNTAAATQAQGEVVKVRQVEDVIDTTSLSSSGNFENYNGLENVFIASGNKTLSSSDLNL